MWWHGIETDLEWKGQSVKKENEREDQGVEATDLKFYQQFIMQLRFN